MMKTRSDQIVKKNKNEIAQGFVEFALAVPILLLVLYGLLEVGRLLFIYSSTVTAARQAVRYGAVTGINDGGVVRYQDCAGIRAAARNVGFINDFPDSGFDITFDSGPGTTTKATCNGSDYLLSYQAQNGDRLVVSVSTTFSPIVPLVPLEPMTIQSSSSRTILVDIDINVTAVPQSWDGSTSTPTNTPSPTATNTPTNTPTPTETPTSTPTSLYSPTPSNTPTITNTPTNTFTPTITFTPSATGTPTNTPTATATPIECFVSHAGLSVIDTRMLLTVYNNSAEPITINSITIFYNASSPAGQSLLAIYGGGTQMWSGSLAGSPVTVSTFLVNETIEPGGSLPLKFYFNKQVKKDGSENVVISFSENGCPIHETAP
jgi:Flp pilus assembly protein TadG